MGSLSNKTVTELRKILRERGMKVSGKKDELVTRLQSASTTTSFHKPPIFKASKKSTAAIEGKDKPILPRQAKHLKELVRPNFDTATATRLKLACEAIVNGEGQLTFQLQGTLFSHLFWPPPPNWCLAPLDMSTATSRVPSYGHGSNADDQIWKHAVWGIFQPERKYFQLFEHILIPIYFSWADSSLAAKMVPSRKATKSVKYKSQPMWGLLHYRKGASTAHMHVLTEWQEVVFNNKAHHRIWTKKLVEQLTGEKGMDANLFYGNRARIKTKWLPNLVGEDWRKLGWSGRDMGEVSQQSFYYILWVATQLVVRGVQDCEIPAFGSGEAFEGLAQALLGASTALEHGDVGVSAGRGVKHEVPEGASPEVLAHRAALETALTAFCI